VHRLRPDVVTVGSQLIRDVHADPVRGRIVRMAVELADELRAAVLADGVEDPGRGPLPATGRGPDGERLAVRPAAARVPAARRARSPLCSGPPGPGPLTPPAEYSGRALRRAGAPTRARLPPPPRRSASPPPPAIGIRTARSARAAAPAESPSPSVPSTNASRLGAVARPPVQVDGVRRPGVSATHCQPGRPDQVDPVRPGRQPGPRHLEHAAHRDPDRAPVERVRAARGDQHGIRTEPGRRADDRPDVGVVDDVLQDQRPPGAGQHFGRVRQRRPVQSRRSPRGAR